MHIDPWILTFSAVTVIATIWVGFWSARRSKTASDFYVAGRSVSVGWNASAISGEYLSAASFMGVAGMVMSSGYDALWYPVCYACGYLFLLLFIAGPLRRFGAYTIPDFAEGRYDSPVFRKIAVVFVLFIGFFYTMPQMKGAGTTLAYIFPGLPYWAGVVLVGAVITLNVALGGMKGITLVQAFQYWAKMFAISVPIFVLMAVYGHYGKQLGANGESVRGQRAIRFDPEDFPAAFFKSTGQTTSYGGKVNEIRQKASRFDIVSFKLFLPSPKCRVQLAMAFYQKERRSLSDTFTSYFDTNALNLELDTTLVPPPTNSLRASVFRSYVREVFATNGITIVDISGNAAAIVLTTNLPKFTGWARSQLKLRQPLPEKAPADETWLSPFGPLTTKAAKATAAALTNPVSQALNTNLFMEIRSAREMFDKLSRDLNKQLPPSGILGSADALLKDAATYLPSSFSFNPASARIQNLGGLLMHYRDATGARVLLARELQGVSITFLPEKTLGASEFIRLADAVMTTNGTKVLRLESGGVAVVAADKMANYSILKKYHSGLTAASADVQKAWLAKHQRPLALLYTYSLIIALVCGTAGLPHILVRFYTNPDGVAAKRTTMWVMILIGIFYVFPPVFGVMGRNLLPDLYAGVGAKGTDKIVLELPRLLNEKYAPLGSILSGITCAGAFAAFMSTFSGLLVSMTGAMAHDVYGRMLKPKSTPEQRLRAFKVCTVLIGGIAIVLGCFVEPLEINFMVGQAFAIAAASYFPLLFMSVWWRGMTMRGAAIGMLTGGLCALAAVTLTNFSNLALDKGPMGKVFAGFAPLNPFWAAHPLLRILCEQPAIWTVPLAIGLMIVIGKLTSRAVSPDTRMKMLVLHAPEKLGLKQEYIQEHQHGH